LDLLKFINQKLFIMKNWLILTMLKSKKVWFTIAAIVIPNVARLLGVSEDAVGEIFWALVALTGAQGVADLGKGAKK
tara:strand:+ start:267 stop:497 length:231 start_codon:yes stop_codon:yes gene_type:complete